MKAPASSDSMVDAINTWLSQNQVPNKDKTLFSLAVRVVLAVNDDLSPTDVMAVVRETNPEQVPDDFDLTNLYELRIAEVDRLNHVKTMICEAYPDLETLVHFTAMSFLLRERMMLLWEFWDRYAPTAVRGGENNARQEAKRERSAAGKRAVEARYTKPNGTRDKQKSIRATWATGKYTSRDICAEQEWSGLGFGSFKAARNALTGTPNPNPWPAKTRR